jgi:hypothetical protein
VRTWNYKGNQNGYQTRIQRGHSGLIHIFQTKDGGVQMNQTNDVSVVVFREDQLRKILSDKKRFPREKKSKRGK